MNNSDSYGCSQGGFKQIIDWISSKVMSGKENNKHSVHHNSITNNISNANISGNPAENQDNQLNHKETKDLGVIIANISINISQQAGAK